MNLLEAQRREFQRIRREDQERHDKQRQEDKTWRELVESSIEARFQQQIGESKEANRYSRISMFVSVAAVIIALVSALAQLL